MANSLCTRYQYKSIVPTNTNVTDVQIDAAIPIASTAVSDWLHRELVSGTYKNWFTLDGCNPTEVFLPEIPVTRIQMVAGVITVGTIYYTGTSNYAMLSSDLDGMYVSYMSNLGVITTTSILYVTYPTLGQLFAQLQTIAGWKVSYSAGTWAGNPSRLLKPIASQLAVQGVIIDSAHWIACKSTLIDESTLELNGSLGRWVYVEYQAGYVLPVDNVPHTALTTAGTVPEPIILATINICRDYLTLQSTNGGMIRNEALGDYSYSLAAVPLAEMNDIVQRQSPLLIKYKRLGWI